jgi:hypothetical protein
MRIASSAPASQLLATAPAPAQVPGTGQKVERIVLRF